MEPITSFQTDRLRATRLIAEDLPELQRMHQDLRVMASLGGVRSHDRTMQFLQTNLQHWDRYHFGLWMFRTDDGMFAGRGGLRHVRVAGQDEIELAYALVSECWGRGFATEMARAILSIAFGHLDLKEVVGFTLSTNCASVRVMEKVGLAFEREISHAGLPHVLHRKQRV